MAKVAEPVVYPPQPHDKHAARSVQCSEAACSIKRHTKQDVGPSARPSTHLPPPDSSNTTHVSAGRRTGRSGKAPPGAQVPAHARTSRPLVRTCGTARLRRRPPPCPPDSPAASSPSRRPRRATPPHVPVVRGSHGLRQSVRPPAHRVRPSSRAHRRGALNAWS
jgi:hypothetical protein